MKKVLAILVVLLMVPFAAMAATMSDSDLAAVTGQSGVTIGIGSMTVGVSFGSLTWGDYDGFGATYTDAGYVNILAYPAPMHITVDNLALTIDVGTDSVGTLGTAVQIGVAAGIIKLDAFIADIQLDDVNGAVADYGAINTNGTLYSYVPADLDAVEAGTSAKQLNATDQILGVFGISNVTITLPTQGFNITISAH